MAAPELRIECGPCALRPWQPGDAADLTRHANERRVWEGLRDRFPHPYTRSDAEGWIAFAGQREPPLNLAIALDDEPVGGIGIELQEDVHRHTAELGYWLGVEVWGRGLATAAVKAMTSYAFATLAIRRLYATPFSSNPASARVLEKLGYRHEGRLRGHVFKAGRILDLDVYGVLREEWAGKAAGW